MGAKNRKGNKSKRNPDPRQGFGAGLERPEYKLIPSPFEGLTPEQFTQEITKVGEHYESRFGQALGELEDSRC